MNGDPDEAICSFPFHFRLGLRRRRKPRPLSSEEDRRPNGRDGLFPFIRGHVARNLENLRAGRKTMPQTRQKHRQRCNGRDGVLLHLGHASGKLHVPLNRVAGHPSSDGCFFYLKEVFCLTVIIISINYSKYRP